MLEMNGDYYNAYHIMEVLRTAEGRDTIIVLSDGRRLLLEDEEVARVAAQVDLALRR